MQSKRIIDVYLRKTKTLFASRYLTGLKIKIKIKKLKLKTLRTLILQNGRDDFARFFLIKSKYS